MNIVTVKSYNELSAIAANIIAAQLNRKPDSVLGLATGSTPLGTYQNLVRMNREGICDFSQAVTFNLDEYCGLNREHPQSYYYFMMENLFKSVNINLDNIHIPNGMAADLNAECDRYEHEIKQAGGVDLQLLGIGLNGHIGFNEPGDVFYNRTTRVTLTDSTIQANKRFFENADQVPKTALSMGIGTIMAAQEVLVIAGADKAEIIQKLGADTVSPMIPASILHYHPRCTVLWAEK